MLHLTQRPLSASDVDASLFVGRVSELEHLQRAYRLSFNTLLLAERGAGTTTLVRHLERLLNTQGVRTCYCDVAGVTTANEFIATLQRSLRGVRGPQRLDRQFVDEIVADQEDEVVVSGPDTEWQILRLGDRIRDRPLFILDGAHDPSLIHTVCGRYRDQMWQLPFTWLICGLRDRRSGYVQPPADAFFDTQIVLGSLDEGEAEDLLLRRIDEPATREHDAAQRIRSCVSKLVDSANGNPRQLLAAAREVALGGDDTAAETERLLMAAADVGRPAAMLVAELRGLGSASASDEILLGRLGWTRARATQVFKQLLDAGVVVATSERQPGAAGRPRTVYRLNVSGGVTG